jgi:hypothetical protein
MKNPDPDAKDKRVFLFISVDQVKSAK